jgi:hypothetical protein
MINENRKSIFITFAVFGFIILQFFIFSNAVQADIIGYTQVITLNPGWNIISTPRLVQSHQFSVAESVSNFDIYLLNASSTSGWATMQELGQSEFTPLYGYFINNKTGVNQSLILNYLQNVSPGNRLFTRQLSRGWNVIGVANPTYSLKQKTSDNIDTNNIQSILTTLATSAEVVLDFTADQTPLSSVKVGDTWKSEIFNDANSLNDFRDTKAYAVYLSSVSDYQGYQDNSPVDDGILPYGNMNLAATGNYGAQTVTAPQTAFKLGSFVLVGNSTEGVNLNLVTVGFTPTGNFTVSKLQNVYIAYNGTQTTARSLVPTASSTWSISVNLPASGTMSFDVYADIVSGFTSGSMRTDMTVNGITANSSQLVSSLDTAGQLITVDVGSITAGVDGSTPVSTLVKGGSAVDVAVYKFTTTNNAYNLNSNPAIS